MSSGVITRLTEDDAIEEHPIWSPDGEFVAHLSDQLERGEEDLMITDREGCWSWNLTEDFPEEVHRPDWLPVGQSDSSCRRRAGCAPGVRALAPSPSPIKPQL